MYILTLVVLLSSIDPYRPPKIKEERIAVSYPNTATGEMAQMVRQEIGSFYVYRIKIGSRYISEGYPDIETFRWSDDGQHFFFLVILKNGQKQVVQDGRVHARSFDLVGQIQFSNKSGQLAYIGFLAASIPQKPQVEVILDGASIKVFKAVTDLFFDKNDNLVYRGEELD